MVAARKAAFAEESAEVEVLFANLEKLSGLTNKIQGSLNRLDTSGKNVETAIGPVYGNTRKLQQTHRNIDWTLEVIDKLRAPLEGRDQEESTIRAEPRKVGIKEYVAALQRVDRSLRGLRASNISANQSAMKEMAALVNYGNRQLEEVFRQNVINCTGTQIEPLHYITKDKPFPSISDKDIPELRHINRYFSAAAGKSYGEYSTMKIFAEIRGSYVSRSLSTSSAASISTARKQNIDAPYRRGTCGIGTYSTAIEGMIAAEFDNIKRISDPEDWSRAIVSTSQQALYDFGKTLRDLNAHIQGNMMADCFLAYEILEIVSATARRLDLMTSDLKKAVLETLQPIHEIAKSSLSRMLDDTKQKVQALISLPLDGSSVGVIGDTITRLQNLSQYLSPVTTIMSTVGDGNWASSPATSASLSIRSFDTALSASEGNQLFAHYASDMLEVLVTQLDGRARLLLKNGGIQNVFMCNNVTAIENQLKSSEIDNLIPAIQPRIDMWRSKYVKMYLTSWNAATGQLLDVQYTNRASGRPTSGGAPDSASVVKGLNSKEREIIKEKFKVFNSAFDELVTKHKNYNMERDVRNLLGREVQRVIEPLYGRFWDRYHEIDKGKGKYVRYSKSDLSMVFMGMT